MSVLTKEAAGALLAPLRGRVTLMSFHDKDVKIRAITFIVGSASRLAIETRILDMDAFCSTRVQQLIENTSSEFLDHVKLLLPSRGFDVGSLPPLISSKTGLLILDDLNSLFSLASTKSESHRLFAVMKMISYHARINKSWVIATAYRSDWNRAAKTNQHTLESLADVTLESRSEVASGESDVLDLFGGVDVDSNVDRGGDEDEAQT